MLAAAAKVKWWLLLGKYVVCTWIRSLFFFVALDPMTFRELGWAAYKDGLIFSF